MPEVKGRNQKLKGEENLSVSLRHLRCSLEESTLSNADGQEIDDPQDIDPMREQALERGRLATVTDRSLEQPTQRPTLSWKAALAALLI